MGTDWIWDTLEPVEQHIADLLLQGRANREIVAEVGLSRARVQDYIKRIVIKAGAASTREALSLMVQERETSSLLRILDEATDAVLIVQDKLVKFANKALAEMLGYSPSEMIDIPFSAFMAPRARGELSWLCEARLRCEPFPGRYVTHALCKMGEIEEIAITSAGVVRYNGRPAMMAIIVKSRQRAQ